MDLQRLAPRGQRVAQVQQEPGEQVDRVARPRRALRVLPHLAPDAAQHEPRLGLEHAVRGLANAVEEAARARRLDVAVEAERVAQHSGERLERAGPPDEEERVDRVGGEARPEDAHALDRAGLAVEPAMGVEREPRRVSRLRGKEGERVVEHDAPRMGGARRRAGAEGDVARREPAVIAADQRMRVGAGRAPGLVARMREDAVDRPGIVLRVAGRARGARQRRERPAARHGKGRRGEARGRWSDRHAQRAGPGVGRVAHPVLVRQHREAAAAPGRAPGVLDDEAARVVADQREGVAARLALRRARRDDGKVGGAPRRGRGPLAEQPVPASVDLGRDIDRADLADRRLQVDHRVAIDAVVDAERPRRRVARPVGGGRDEALRAAARHAMRPEPLGAGAVLVPALEGAAAARALVVVARPFVVAPGELVEHARADRREAGRATRLDGAAPEQEVRDAGEAEARARALSPLVEDEAGARIGANQARDVRVDGPLRRQRAQRRAVGPVAQVQPVGTRVEEAPRHGRAGA